MGLSCSVSEQGATPPQFLGCQPLKRPILHKTKDK
jgi:hypothetical protein